MHVMTVLTRSRVQLNGFGIITNALLRNIGDRIKKGCLKAYSISRMLTDQSYQVRLEFDLIKYSSYKQTKFCKIFYEQV